MQISNLATKLCLEVVEPVWFVSSIQMKAIETALIFLHAWQNKGMPYLSTFNGLDLMGEKDYLDFIYKVNESRRCGSKTFLSIGHEGFCGLFIPEYRKRVFEKNDTPTNLGESYGTGTYLNLETGEWREIV